MWKAEMRSMFGFESQGLRCLMLVRAIPIALAAVLVLPDGAIAQSGEASGVSDRLKSLFKKKSTTGAAAGAPKAPAGPTGTATGAAGTGTGAAAGAAGAGAATGAAAKSPAAAPSSAVLPPWPGTTRFVDPNNPASINDGEGTASAPYRTIEYAMTRLQPGEHVVDDVFGGTVPEQASRERAHRALEHEVDLFEGDRLTGASPLEQHVGDVNVRESGHAVVLDARGPQRVARDAERVAAGQPECAAAVPGSAVATTGASAGPGASLHWKYGDSASHLRSG